MKSRGGRWAAVAAAVLVGLGASNAGGMVGAAGEAPIISRIHFVSCNKPERETKMWDIIEGRAGDLLILGGDNVYADTKLHNQWFCPAFMAARNHCPASGWLPATPARLTELYKLLDNATSSLRTAMEEKQQLKRRSRSRDHDKDHDEDHDLDDQQPPPVIVGTWDDHDYGLNDGDKTLGIREESAALLLDFLREPADSPRRERAEGGVYGVQTTDYTTDKMREQGRSLTVATVLLDTRFHKDPYDAEDEAKGTSGDFLGEAQWEWLERELRKSTADVHLIVSSIQVLQAMEVPGKRGEHWSRFPAARDRLLQLIEDSDVTAPLLLSGDVHLGEFAVARCGPGKAMVEVTSSGVTHSWSQLPLPMGMFMRLYRWVVPQPYGGDEAYTLLRNFAELDFTDGGTEVGVSVTARIKTIDTCSNDISHSADCADGIEVRTALEQTWRLSELTAGAAGSCVPLRGHTDPIVLKAYKLLYLAAVVVSVVGAAGIVPIALAVWLIGRVRTGNRSTPQPKSKVT